LSHVITPSKPLKMGQWRNPFQIMRPKATAGSEGKPEGSA